MRSFLFAVEGICAVGPQRSGCPHTNGVIGALVLVWLANCLARLFMARSFVSWPPISITAGVVLVQAGGRCPAAPPRPRLTARFAAMGDQRRLTQRAVRISRAGWTTAPPVVSMTIKSLSS